MSEQALTISEAFDLPRREEITAMGFVIKLKEAAPDSAEVHKLVEDYVITPAVARELPRILKDMEQVYNRGEEYGRFIHGSFGSGKSHFMTILALLLEDVPAVWTKSDEAFQTACLAHRAWIARARLLVVRIHMLSVKGRNTGLDRAVYEAFNDALKRRGKKPFEFLNVDGILDEARTEADTYGNVVWQQLKAQGIVGSAEDFEATAKGSAKARERLARAWLAFKKRDPADAGIDPNWTEGLRRMGEHARAEGFGGIVLMIDEFLLWLAEKSGQEFVREINDLNVIVDHNTGQRPVPVFVFVARQRNLQEFFPDLADDAKIHEHLDHHSKRFEITQLQDVELRHIVKGRVLKPKAVKAVEKAIAGLAEQQKRLLPALQGGTDLDYLKDVYPFHPTLIEMLVDVTSLMQRERSALRLLYELLVIHYPHLPLGAFLPVGSAFEAIFPPSGVEASKKVELLQDIHREYYDRLARATDQLLKDENTGFNEERRKALDQIVKTVLLAEVSPRLKGPSGLTIERLVQLNAVDVEGGESFRGRLRVAETDLKALSQLVPDLQIGGTGKTAIVKYILGRASLTEILSRARSKVDNSNQRFKVFWEALTRALRLEKTKGFEEGSEKKGAWEVRWRGTRRRGEVQFGNVRELPHEAFEPPADTFKILVDYPWDEPGHSVEEDRQKVHAVRRKKGTRYTACWLPRHMTPTELHVMADLAAVRYVRTDVGQKELLETLSPQDRQKVVEEAGVRQHNLEEQLQDLLKEVFVKHGEIQALLSDFESRRPHETLDRNLEHVAGLLMDRQYPQHPNFLAEPRRKDLERLLDWMVTASDTSASVSFDEETGRVLRELGQPLELVNLGQTKASLRLDSRYVADVLKQAEKDTVSWSPIAEHLRNTYGLQDDLQQLFLCFLCRRDHRALNEVNGEPTEVSIGMPASARVRLQRGKVLSAAEWGTLRDLGMHLFGLQKPSVHRSLQSQDRFAQLLRESATDKRTKLQGVHERIVHLEKMVVHEGEPGGARLQQIGEANARLGPLVEKTTDSHRTLTAFLAKWPADADDPVRAVVGAVEGLRDALGELSESTITHLRAGAGNASVGHKAQAHLDKLRERLRARAAELPITREWARSWGEDAQRLIHEIIGSARPTGPEPGPVVGQGGARQPPRPGSEEGGGGPTRGLTGQTGQTGPAPMTAHRLCAAELDTTDPDAISDFLAQVRRTLTEIGEPSVRVVLCREDNQA